MTINAKLAFMVRVGTLPEVRMIFADNSVPDTGPGPATWGAIFTVGAGVVGGLGVWVAKQFDIQWGRKRQGRTDALAELGNIIERQEAANKASEARCNERVTRLEVEVAAMREANGRDRELRIVAQAHVRYLESVLDAAKLPYADWDDGEPTPSRTHTPLPPESGK